MREQLLKMLERMQHNKISYDEISYIMFGDYTGKDTPEEQRQFILDCIDYTDKLFNNGAQ